MYVPVDTEITVFIYTYYTEWNQKGKKLLFEYLCVISECTQALLEDHPKHLAIVLRG
jgi:hypothetical protein